MPQKKRVPNEAEMEVSDDGSSDDSGDENEFEEHNEEIQVDFEGRNPIDTDFGGIRQLLTQLLLKSDVNMSELADYIIGQNYIGSVVTQCEDDEDEDEDDDMADSNVVFGITTAINLNKPDAGCIQQLRNLFTQKVKEAATIEVYEQFKNIFENTSNVVGFLLNERYVNIPPQIAVPLLESLVKEVERANRKKMPFQFTHYLMMLKYYKMTTTNDGKGAKKSASTTTDVYTNAEEEIFLQNSCLEFDFAAQTDNEPESNDVVPFRKIIVFETAKLPQIIESIKTFLD